MKVAMIRIKTLKLTRLGYFGNIYLTELPYLKQKHLCQDRLTLLLGSNANGDYKFKPFLINQSEYPRSMKGYSKQEWNPKLNFLDLSISIRDGKPTFEIYRKPEFIQIIPNSSSHHYSQKHAALHFMLHRLINIPLSEENFAKELNTI